MLDVEYLRNPQPSARPMIYKYRTGVLRKAVVAALREQVTAEGGFLMSCTPAELYSQFTTGNLFEFLHKVISVCDWKVSSGGMSESHVAETLVCLKLEDTDRVAIFVPPKSSLKRHALWPSVEDAASVIEEPEITSRTLLPVLKYLEESTKLAKGLSLTSQPAFMASFENFLQVGGDLAELICAFEDRVVTRTDPRTGRFDAERQANEDAYDRGSNSLFSSLRNLVFQRSRQELVSLLAALSERAQRGQVATEIMADLHCSTSRLLQAQAEGPRSGWRARAGQCGTDSILGEEHAVWLWTVVFLAWEDCLIESSKSMATGERRGPSILIPAFDQLVRTFLDRSAREREGECMGGLWSDLDVVLAKVDGREHGRLSVARLRTVRNLARCLAPANGQHRPWLARLLRAVSRPSTRRTVSATEWKRRGTEREFLERRSAGLRLVRASRR